MTDPTLYRMTATTWALLLLLGLIWGGSYFFGRIAVGHLPPFTLAFFRLSLAALALHIYLRGRFDLYATLRSHWRPFLLLGLLNNAIPHSLILMGQTEIGAGLAAILNATTPIWTVLIANRLTTDEKLTAAKLIGCLLGLLGTVILIGPSTLATSQVPLWALLLPIGASISYGFAAIYGKQFRALPAPVTATGQLTASCLLVLPAALAIDQPWHLAMPPVLAMLAVLALALVSTAFAYILFFRIMAKAGATNTSLVTLLVPPSAILLGVLFLGERFEWIDIVAMALIGLGLLVLDGRILPSRKKLPTAL